MATFRTLQRGLGDVKGFGLIEFRMVYLEVHCTYNLLGNCSYNPSISRVTVVMELLLRL